VVTINIGDVKEHFDEILAKAKAGEDVIIYQEGLPVVRMMAVSTPTGPRVPGSAKGMITMSDDFDAPLPDEILDEFEK
jgi:antitoxin (DNA-binding transcriptional repressor) of toxin-antitoxin stability system